ncbi:MAG: hypothetical protein AAF432_16340, partial [Planctomycetota bacterium]
VRDNMESNPVLQAMNNDIAGGRRAQVGGTPWIYVNGRRVIRWEINKEPVLEGIIERAKELPKTPQGTLRPIPGGIQLPSSNN